MRMSITVSSDETLIFIILHNKIKYLLYYIQYYLTISVMALIQNYQLYELHTNKHKIVKICWPQKIHKKVMGHVCLFFFSFQSITSPVTVAVVSLEINGTPQFRGYTNRYIYVYRILRSRASNGKLTRFTPRVQNKKKKIQNAIEIMLF